MHGDLCTPSGPLPAGDTHLGPYARLAQLGRALALQARGHWFDPSTGYSPQFTREEVMRMTAL